jgi:hypothetical protein
MVPNSHMASEPKDYRNAIGLPEDQREEFRHLYDEVCGISPTAFSLMFLWTQEEGGIRIRAGHDDLHIRDLCKKYERPIGTALSLSVNASALCLKALNWFSLPVVNCAAIEQWNFAGIPAWRKAQASASRGVVH